MFGFFGLIMFNVLREKYLNSRADVVTVQCTVLTMIQDRQRTQRGQVNTTNFVTFELESGERVALSVPLLEYAKIKIGDSGVLNYQRNQFNSFRRYV